MMPAFSAAISSRVLPSRSQWSSPMLVITLSSGVMTLVLSSLPPSPVSITAQSTSISANHLKARPVVISKNESWSRSRSSLYLVRKSYTYSSVTREGPSAEDFLPSTILILSLKSRICGDVYMPTFRPQAARAEASMLAVDPLPLVPAMWTVLYLPSGFPSSPLNSSILSRPGLYASPKETFWTDGKRRNIL